MAGSQHLRLVKPPTLLDKITPEMVGDLYMSLDKIAKGAQERRLSAATCIPGMHAYADYQREGMLPRDPS